MTKYQSPPKYWFISDTHFGHEAAIAHNKRPFDSLLHQDVSLITDWNSVVKPGDKVYVLGDFSFYNAELTSNVLRQLKGQKFLIKGNHDSSKALKETTGWAAWWEYKMIRVDSMDIALFHFPIMSWHKMSYGAYHLHGHCHGNLNYPERYDTSRILDVGVDNLVKFTGKYRPIEWDEVKEILALKRAISVDHHKLKESYVP